MQSLNKNPVDYKDLSLVSPGYGAADSGRRGVERPRPQGTASLGLFFFLNPLRVPFKGSYRDPIKGAIRDPI